MRRGVIEARGVHTAQVRVQFPSPLPNIKLRGK